MSAFQEVLYPCQSCHDGGEGTCYQRDMIAVAPNGEWWCQNCYEEGYPRQFDDEGEPLPGTEWCDLPKVPDYSPARIAELEAALRPFAEMLKGNLTHQPDTMQLDFGPGQDMRFACSLGDLRTARAALAQAPQEGEQS